MNTELAREVFAIVEAKVRTRPSPMEFEMAYQIRVAIDRIRFALKLIEKFGSSSEQTRETGLQLLDALNRLENTERLFEERSRNCSAPYQAKPEHTRYANVQAGRSPQ